MFQIDTTTGAITTFQGDSGKFYLSGERILDYDRVSLSVFNDNYKVLMNIDKDYSISDIDENNGMTFSIAPEDTDSLVVQRGNDFEEYYYSIKFSKQGNPNIEHTFLIGDNTIDDKVPFIVYAKRNEGYKND